MLKEIHVLHKQLIDTDVLCIAHGMGKSLCSKYRFNRFSINRYRHESRLNSSHRIATQCTNTDGQVTLRCHFCNTTLNDRTVSLSYCLRLKEA